MDKIKVNNIAMDDHFHDECGIFGIYTFKPSNVESMLYYGLFSLQHRGQESCGITASDGNTFTMIKDLGCVGDVFKASTLKRLHSPSYNMAIGHVRYATARDNDIKNAQPFVVKSKKHKVISVAHNGNITNDVQLRKLLQEKNVVFQGDSDSELIIHLLEENINVCKDINKALVKTMKQLVGAFALTIIIDNKLIGVRGPNGIRPLCIGKLRDEGHILSSESCALDVIGAKFVRDVKKGEIVILENDKITSLIYNDTKPQKACIFEYVYFARPDSIIDGISVYQARLNQGKQLFVEHPLKADLVLGTPDSGIVAALGYSQASKIPYTLGFVKNKYIARTFIQPSQDLREKDVSIKLNALKTNIENKIIILIDDSIVRGTTSRHLIRNLKQAGAKKIYLLSASPMVKWPCFLGVDTPSRQELFAATHTLKQMKNQIQSDYLGFLSLDRLIKCCGGKQQFCTGCFDGKYPVRQPQKIKIINKEKLQKHKGK